MKKQARSLSRGNGDLQGRQLGEVESENISRLMDLRKSNMFGDLIFDGPSSHSSSHSSFQRTSPRRIKLGWILVQQELQDRIRLELWIILKQYLDLGPVLIQGSRACSVFALRSTLWNDILVGVLVNSFWIHVAFLCATSVIWI